MKAAQATILYFGTPEIAVPPLRALVAAGYSVRCITNPDRPVGRAGTLTNSAVKQAADGLGVPVLQPEKITPAFLAQMRAHRFDAGIVVAYGKILPAALVALPEYGILNIHFSLLPRWRGASPVAAALLAGDRMTGVTIMLLDAGLDTGPVVAQEKISIADNATTASLTRELTERGTKLLLRILPAYLAGTIHPVPQQKSGATMSGRITKEDARLQWSLSAEILARRVRAYIPWPVAWTTLHGKRWKIWESRLPGLSSRQPAGTIILSPTKTPAIVCGDGCLLELLRVQPEGKSSLSGAAFLHGYRHMLGAQAI